MKSNLLVSFSGGRTSAYMAWWLMKNKKDIYNMEFVFANTGKEREETLTFVNKCDKEFGLNIKWVEADIYLGERIGTKHKLTSYELASRNGEPFEMLIKKYGIPNQNAPHCTRELKLQPIKSYVRDVLKWDSYKTALGIRSDEPKRLDWKKQKEQNLIYFAELFYVTKEDINKFWSKQSFDLELKSYEGNCDLCYKKGLRKLMTILKDNPELGDWWKEMEVKYEMFTPISRIEKSKPPYRFFRDNMTIDDIIEESKFPFSLAIDTSKKINDSRQIYLWDDYLDSNNGCTESCEIS